MRIGYIIYVINIIINEYSINVERIGTTISEKFLIISGIMASNNAGPR